MGPVREPQRSEFVLLMRHFLERFSITKRHRRMEMGRRGWCKLRLRRGCRDSSWLCIFGRYIIP